MAKVNWICNLNMWVWTLTFWVILLRTCQLIDKWTISWRREHFLHLEFEVKKYKQKRFFEFKMNDSSAVVTLKKMTCKVQVEVPFNVFVLEFFWKGNSIICSMRIFSIYSSLSVKVRSWSSKWWSWKLNHDPNKVICPMSLTRN